MPMSSGEIEVRSIHSGLTNDPAQKSWPEHDHLGYKDAAESLTKFADLIFSESYGYLAVHGLD